MGGKKKKGKKGYRKKGKAQRSSQPKYSRAAPAGATFAVLYGGGRATLQAWQKSGGQFKSGRWTAGLNSALESLKASATDPAVYMPVVGGLLLSASPSIPGIGRIAKKADRAVKKATKGAFGL